MNEIQKYIAENESRMMEDLFSLIRIPSISALPEHHDDMLACAERWAQLLLEAGADEALVMPSKGNPIVFAQKIVDPSAKTILVYAHYDELPAAPLELWKSQPFEPEIRDGHIWARGADDDKGQSFIQVKALQYLLKNGLLKNNVKFIFEGEEEIGSPSLEAFCEEHKELLKSDVILVSDTSMLGAELPSLTTGLRGLAYWEIEVTGANRDLHSGHFGGAVANPINVLCKIISKITDADGRITIPGFYDDVEEVPQAEREMFARITFEEKKYKDPFSYTPTHTLVLYTNHLPKVGAIDKGTWRRLIVIPFDATIEGNADIKNYAYYLYEHAGGAILSWVIEGSKKVIKDNYKITTPQKVCDAIEHYRDCNDWLSYFLSNS